MTFLAPIAGLIAAAIALPLLVAMYFLKLRRKRLDVSSTLLWKRAIQDLQVNAPFQKLKKSLLLLLQLLLLAALLLAFAGPMIRTSAPPGRRTIIVIDHSASMNATDERPTRLDRAREVALRLVESAGAGSEDDAGSMMIVSFAHQARVVQPFTTDQALLRSAIRGIPATLYARLTMPGADLQALSQQRYAKEPFVDVMPPGSHPETRSVRAANVCRLAVHRPQDGDTVVVLSVIDNLVKGAAGQAVQNMNLMFGLDEGLGLGAPGVMP